MKYRLEVYQDFGEYLHRIAVRRFRGYHWRARYMAALHRRYDGDNFTSYCFREKAP